MVHQFLSTSTTPPPRPPAPKFPGVCKAQLYVVYHSHHSLVFLHWSCNLWYTPSLHFLPSPLSLGCANLYHSHHFLSFCMLHFAVLAYYNLQNTTNPSPTSPPPPISWALLISITLIISLCFCKPCYAVNVTCKFTTSPPSHSLWYAHLYYSYLISLCFSGSCVMLLV